MGRYVSVAGVIIGGICDILVTNILLIPIVAILVIPLIQEHVASTVASAQLKVTMQAPGFAAVSFLVGAIGSIAGGFISASIAKREELLNGLLSTWLCTLFGIAGIFFGQDLFHRLLPLIDIPAAWALGIFGGYLRFRMVRSKAVAA